MVTVFRLVEHRCFFGKDRNSLNHIHKGRGDEDPPTRMCKVASTARPAVDARLIEDSQVNLTSDHPYWFMKSGLLHTYPFLDHDVCCDVAVVGAGITGAMVAHRLSGDGNSVIVIDGRDVCRGSTAASTALLQCHWALQNQPLMGASKPAGV